MYLYVVLTITFKEKTKKVKSPFAQHLNYILKKRNKHLWQNTNILGIQFFLTKQTVPHAAGIRHPAIMIQALSRRDVL